MPEFRYIAFDEDTGLPIAHDSRAIFALRRADRENSEARIFIIDAGALGLEIWSNKMTLPQAEAFVLQGLRERVKVLEEAS